MGIISSIVTMKLLLQLLLLLILQKPPDFMENLLYASYCMSDLQVCVYMCLYEIYISFSSNKSPVSLGIVILIIWLEN